MQGPPGTDGGLRPEALGVLSAGLAGRESNPLVVVTAGSSTTLGLGASEPSRRWVDTLAAKLQSRYPLTNGAQQPATAALGSATRSSRGIQFVNAGSGGTTSSNYLAGGRLEALIDLRPTIVIHMVGANDFSADVPPTLYRTNIETSIDRIDSMLTVDPAHILVHSFERFDVKTPAHSWAEYGLVLRQVASSRPREVAYADLSGQFMSAGVPGTDSFDLVTSDSVHPSDAGHAMIADLLAQFLGA